MIPQLGREARVVEDDASAGPARLQLEPGDRIHAFGPPSDPPGLDDSPFGHELEVAPDAPVVTLAPGDLGLIKPGAVVFVMATTKKPDGTFEADRLVATKDGVNPPM